MAETLCCSLDEGDVFDQIVPGAEDGDVGGARGDSKELTMTTEEGDPPGASAAVSAGLPPGAWGHGTARPNPVGQKVS